MADAMVERRPAVRFFCHRCNVEFEDVLQDYTCPYCASGFIEQLENGAERVPPPGQTFNDANMSNIGDTGSIDEEVVAELLDSPVLDSHNPQYRVQSFPPVLRDIAFLMSGGQLRGAVRRPRLMTHLARALSGGERQPPGTVTAGAPFVLVGAPGDYVFGGEALDAVVTQLLGQLEHSGPPPMPRDRLEEIPSETVTEEQAAANASCSVCWENFQKGETVSRLECEHVFHSGCITPWLQLHATCPICRRTLVPESSEPPPATTPSTTTTASSTASTNSSTTTTTTNTTGGETTATNPPRQRHTFMPRVVIRRSAHPLFRRASQTLAWDSLRDMSTSSDSNTSVSTAGVWARPSPTNSTSNSSTSVNDRTQNYHTDFDCD